MYDIVSVLSEPDHQSSGSYYCYFGCSVYVPDDHHYIACNSAGTLKTYKNQPHYSFGASAQFWHDTVCGSSGVEVATVQYIGTTRDSLVCVSGQEPINGRPTGTENNVYIGYYAKNNVNLLVDIPQLSTPSVTAPAINDTRFKKLRVALKYYLHGAQYYTALKAMEFAEEYHIGTRKDGITPEFQHQVEIALYITTLKNVGDEERAIIGALLHDVREDYGVEYSTILDMFGEDVANDNKLLTKRFKGVGIDRSSYFTNMLDSPYAVLIKGVDRINNMQSMIGVFTPKKMESYKNEVVEDFQPMIKTAAEKYPELFMAYMNIRSMLKNQTSLIEAVLGGINEK